jgi:hypothetical protein
VDGGNGEDRPRADGVEGFMGAIENCEVRNRLVEFFGGVRCKIDSTDSHHWDFIPIEFNNGESVLKYYSDTKDNPYGWTDLLQTQIFKRKTADDKGDFCSEWCAAALGIPSPQQYSPDELGELVKWANSNIKQ